MASILSQLAITSVFLICISTSIHRVQAFKSLKTLHTSSTAIQHMITRCHTDAFRNKRRQSLEFDSGQQLLTNHSLQEILQLPSGLIVNLKSSITNRIECRESGTLSPASLRLETAGALCTISISLRGRIREHCSTQY